MEKQRFKRDLEAFVQAAPHLVLVLEPDFTIVAANDALLHATHKRREELIGRRLFEAFPDNPANSEADGESNLRASLERVLATRRADKMPTQRYDVRRSGDGAYECRYWHPLNYPVLDDDGRVVYLIHQSEEVTELVALRERDAAHTAALTEANARFQAVYDQGLFAGRLDLGGKVIDVNRSSLEQCGYTREDVIGKPFWECGWWNRSPEVQAWLKAGISRAIAGEYFHGESPYFWADGTERIVDFACMPVKDDAGNVLFLVPTGMDITERARGALDRRATEILESITDGFFALDREWRFTYLNRQAQRILGKTPAELIGRIIWEVYPGLDGSAFARIYRGAMNAGTAASATEYYEPHDCWYEAHAYPAPEGISVYFRDVSERKRAEAERDRLVQESETQKRIYEAALSNTPDLVYVFDLEHRFIYANEALLTMWGRTRDEALGRNCLELGYEPWHAEMHDREIEQVVATRAPIRGEVPFTGTGGRRIYDYIFVPVIGADGDVVAVAGTTRDVTDRQQAEQAIREQAERLREADRAKDEFLATLAHELRNPLAPIANSLEILKRAGNNAELAATARGTLERQLKHLVRLVDDLLDVSRITRGRLELRRQRVELGSIVEQALEACRSHVDSRGHELTVSSPDLPIPLDADAVRLVQVFSNLVTNAAKYTAPGGKLALRVALDNGDAVVTISDSGIGIAPDMLDRVFDMFIRADQSIERSQDGLGVGLTLARRLAELHGGTIVARSDGLGSGSEFTVRLPIAG